MADKHVGNGWMLLGEPGYPRPNLRCVNQDLWLEMDKDDLEVMCDGRESFTKFIPVSALVELLRANGYTVRCPGEGT